MLQQTTVAAVVPYFERFLAAFPTVAALAAANEQRVLKLWEGLGYYRRARHLHQAAKILVEEQGGCLPDDPALWAKLPGVGRYILGAVLSQAFDRKLPIVEANSLRVLTRLFGYRGDPRRVKARRGSGLQRRHYCRPSVSATSTRPLWNWARLSAHRQAEVRRLSSCGKVRCQAPERPGADPSPEEATNDYSSERDRCRDPGWPPHVVVPAPPDAARWQNMWEIPHAVLNSDETLEAAVVRVVRRTDWAGC